MLWQEYFRCSISQKYRELVFKLLSRELAQTCSLSTMLGRETQTLYSMRIQTSLVIRCRRSTLTLVLGYIVTSTQRRLPCFSALHSARQLYCHTGMQIIGLERTRLESVLRQPIPHFCAHGLRHYKLSDHCTLPLQMTSLPKVANSPSTTRPRGGLIRSHSL